jgi:hypothetical protein
VVFAAPVAVGLCLAGQSEWPTLRQELRKYGIPAEAFPDADRQITSFAVHSDADWFACYWHMGSDRLPDELRLRTPDRATGVLSL